MRFASRPKRSSRPARKILDRVRIDREALEKQVTQLREKFGDLRDAMNAE